jgi:hypothetical protein
LVNQTLRLLNGISNIKMLSTSRKRVSVESGASMINDVCALRVNGALEIASELGVDVCLMPASVLITGITRTSSSLRETGLASGRVDSPPISIISAPWSIRHCAF